MLKWLRPAAAPHQTALVMLGLKAGDRLVIAGTPDASLVADLAGITGLNGRTLAVAPSPSARAALQAAADAAGTLVDIVDAAGPAIPVEDASHDVVVLAAATRVDAAALAEGFRALRAGGRLLVIEGVRRTGLFVKGTDTPPAHADEAVRDMLAAGGRAARRLGTAEGVTYYEARR